jgi:hypothetical protein
VLEQGLLHGDLSSARFDLALGLELCMIDEARGGDAAGRLSAGSQLGGARRALPSIGKFPPAMKR